MAKTNPKCVPLDAVAKIANQYLNCWETINSIRKDKGKSLPDWNDRCYIPIAATIAITNGNEFNIEGVNDASLMAACAAWRPYKQVYQFPKELEEILYEQAEDMADTKLPIEVLYNLPYPCIYIEAPNLLYDTHGFFVYFDDHLGDGDKRMELRFYILDNKGKGFPACIHLEDGGTLYDCVLSTINETERLRKKTKTQFVSYAQIDKAEKIEAHMELVSKMLQLVLYVCAENSEIKRNEIHERIRKAPTYNNIKDKYRELEILECGTGITEKIRVARSRGITYLYEKTSDNSAKGKSKSPHVRRGHWHHFWKGSKGDRQLILRWLPPMYINADNINDINVININKVRREDSDDIV